MKDSVLTALFLVKFASEAHFSLRCHNPGRKQMKGMEKKNGIRASFIKKPGFYPYSSTCKVLSLKIDELSSEKNLMKTRTLKAVENS